MGIFAAAGNENKSEELLNKLKAAGTALADPDDHNTAKLVITWVATKSVVVRTISKEVLAKAGLISCLDYYNERHTLKLC